MNSAEITCISKSQDKRAVRLAAKKLETKEIEKLEQRNKVKRGYFNEDRDCKRVVNCTRKSTVQG